MQAHQYPVGPNKMAVNKQFNSPINLYSNQSLNETLSKQSTVLSNGAIGIDFKQLAAPNLAKSAVLRMLEEEESGSRGGVKRVAWPPLHDPEQNSPYAQGESNGIILEANPPAPLYYSPSASEGQQNQPRWEATEPAVTVFSIPSKIVAPVPPPSVITLRSQPPITQAPPPVYKSQPAIDKQVTNAIPNTGKMLGDQKWPPADYKARKAAEEMEQATKPQLKPKLVRKDYSSFFAQHALTPNYTGYRVPPGTQRFDENGRPINGNM